MIVYTAIFGKRDNLKDDQNKGGAKFVLFTEYQFPEVVSNTWEIRYPRFQYTDMRRNARYFKLTPEIYFNDTTMWIDGSIKVLQDPSKLADKYLKDADMAVFKHPNRDCLYKEADVCKVAHFDHEDIIDHQIQRYRNEGYPERNGLAETKVVIRKNNEKVKEFDRLWFYELMTNSLRDQISFNYCVWKTGIKVEYIEPLYHPSYTNGEFHYFKHIT